MAQLAQAEAVELLRPESARDPAFRARLSELAADVFLVASYGELFDQELLTMPARACLNVHGSLLPRWRGAAPVQAAILAGDEVSGVSVQRMVRALDAGDVLLSRETPIGPETTGGELFDRLAELGADAALAALDLIAAGDAQFTPQDPAAVTRCRKLAKSAGTLDWSQDATALERRVRAMTPRPGARTTLPDGRVLGVKRATVVTGRSGVAGTPDAESLDQGRLVIHAGKDALELIEVQPAGKRPMPAADFLRGARLDPEARLGQEQA